MTSAIMKFIITCFFAAICAVAQEEPTDAPFSTTDITTSSSDEISELDTCADYVFPEDDFSQSDTSKVYTEVALLESGPFFENNMTKYATVYGVRVIGESNVSDDKIIHLAKVLAQFLDNDQDGKADHEDTTDILRQRHAMLFIVDDPALPEKLLSSDKDTGLPAPLKECPFAFDFEVADRIQPGVAEEENCETSDGNNDRSVGFVSDHVVGRSWPMFMTQGMETEAYKTLEEMFDASIKNDKTFDLDAAGCPEDDLEYCGFVMFSSWAATSYLGVDKCWCQDAGAWKMCTPQELKENNPDLFAFMQNRIKNIPDGKYEPNAA